MDMEALPMLYKARIKQIDIYMNDPKSPLTMAQAKAQTGCDIICNGFMFNRTTGKPVYNIELGGNDYRSTKGRSIVQIRHCKGKGREKVIHQLNH